MRSLVIVPKFFRPTTAVKAYLRISQEPFMVLADITTLKFHKKEIESMFADVLEGEFCVKDLRFDVKVGGENKELVDSILSVYYRLERMEVIEAEIAREWAWENGWYGQMVRYFQYLVNKPIFA